MANYEVVNKPLWFLTDELISDIVIGFWNGWTLKCNFKLPTYDDESS